MSYVDQHLLPNEAVTYKTTLHWKVYLWPVLLTVFVFIPSSFSQPQPRTERLPCYP